MSELADAIDRVREARDGSALCHWVPYARYLGMRFELVDDRPLFHLPHRDELIGNPALPALHGGVVAGFMENAAMMQVLLESREARLPKSVDFAIDYLRSARTRDCHARCELVRQGRRVAQVQIRCWQDDEQRPIATARAHFLLAAIDEAREERTVDQSANERK